MLTIRDVVEVAALLYCAVVYTLAQRTKRQAGELLEESAQHLEKARGHLIESWRHDPDFAICQVDDCVHLLQRVSGPMDCPRFYSVKSVHANMGNALTMYQRLTERAAQALRK